MSQDNTCRPPSGEPLIGGIIRLDPFRDADLVGLHRVMSDPRACGGGYPFERPHASIAETHEFFSARHARGVHTWTMRLVHPGFGQPDLIVGTTAVSEVDTVNEKVHLGGTFIDRDHWGSGINAEAKLLVLRQMFEECGFGRVKIQADVRNTRSRDAIVRLGAQFEGIVRRDIRRLDGTWRDTVVYSILSTDWPGVRVGLQERTRTAIDRVAPVLTSVEVPVLTSVEVPVVTPILTAMATPVMLEDATVA